MNRLWAVLRHACGFNERRCIACLRPFEALPAPIPSHDHTNLYLRSVEHLCCPSCQAGLRSPLSLCTRCGLPLSEPVAQDKVCGQCLVEPPPWSRLYVLGPHQGLLRDLLLRAKFGGDLPVCRALGRLLAARILSDAVPEADALVPMPLHPSRLRQRGFNQCQEIAVPMHALLGLPRCPDFARRTLATRPQTGLHRKERLRNLDRAFAASPAVKGRRVLLLDDTLTTGTSLRRVSACLLEAGALSLEVAVIAVAVRHAENRIPLASR